jgi:hypothetical protein
MERWIGILLIVAAIWAGLEYYSKGEAAFGGLFASGDAPAAAEKAWAGERAATKWRSTTADREATVEDRSRD